VRYWNQRAGLFMAALTTLLLSCAAFGQYVEYRGVRGVVKFRDGEPVRGAVVQLKNTRTLQIRSFITKKDGLYHFDGLSTEVDYELRAQYHGRFSGSKTLSQFNSKREATVDLTVDNGG
jgi:hypothetical protein